MDGHLLAGYMVNDWLQPVLRYGTVAQEGVDNDVQEFGGGVSVYFFGHKLKWQTDVIGLSDERASADGAAWAIRSQAQLAN